MLVTIDTVNSFGLFSTVITFEGTDPETGDRLTVGVDHRPARDIRFALDEQGEVEVEVEDWAIISRVSAAKAALIATRRDKAAFLASIPKTIDLGGDVLPVSGLGRFRPGGDGFYASIEVSVLNSAKPEGRQYSTHTLIFNDETPRWLTETGHYDLSESEAATDLAQR